MKIFKTIFLLAFASLSVATVANAITVTYSVSGVDTFSLGDPNLGFKDTLALAAGGGSFDINPGDTKIESLNALIWYVGNSPVSDGSTIAISQPRTITVNGTQSLPLVGDIVYHDSVNDLQLQINGGNTVSFNLGGYVLDVTPIAYDKFAQPGVNYTMPADNLMATFTLSADPQADTQAVPEGGFTGMLLGMAIGGIAWIRRKIS